MLVAQLIGETTCGDNLAWMDDKILVLCVCMIV